MTVFHEENEGLVNNTKSEENEEEISEVEKIHIMQVHDEVSSEDDDNEGSEDDNSNKGNSDEESENENYSVEAIVDYQTHKG